MTQMGVIVDCRTASIPGYFASLKRYKGNRWPWFEGVVYFELCHRAGSGGCVLVSGNESA